MDSLIRSQFVIHAMIAQNVCQSSKLMRNWHPLFVYIAKFPQILSKTTMIAGLQTEHCILDQMMKRRMLLRYSIRKKVHLLAHLALIMTKSKTSLLYTTGRQCTPSCSMCTAQKCQCIRLWRKELDNTVCHSEFPTDIPNA